MILFVLTLPVVIIASLLTAAPAEEKTKGLTWNRKFYQAESKLLEAVPWYKNYRVLSIILVLCTAVLVIFWW
jgi:SSS family solute:Na+ symporter